MSPNPAEQTGGDVTMPNLEYYYFRIRLWGARVANRRKCNDEFSNYGQNAIRITILPELLTALKLAKESCIKILVIAPG